MATQFERAAVLGIGLIGGSFALAAKRAGLVGRVVGVARSETTRALALERGAADEVTPDPAAAVAGADLVYLAAPITAICEHLRTLAPHFAPGALVTDAGSTKVAILRAAEALPPEVRFVGGHPMAGSEQAGVSAAREDLFRGTVYFLARPVNTPPAHLSRIADLVTGLGARPVLVTPEVHDRVVAATSHLPHLLAWALTEAAAHVDSGERLADFTAGAWRDTTRLADSLPEVWADILLTNAHNLTAVAGDFSHRLEALLEAVQAGDRERLIRLLEHARQAHRRIAES